MLLTAPSFSIDCIHLDVMHVLDLGIT